MLRSTVAAGVAGLAVTAGVAAPCAAIGGGVGDRPSPPASAVLVYMQQVRPVTITPQTITVYASGEYAITAVIGELTIPRPAYFRLGARRLSTLHTLIRRADLPALHIISALPSRKLVYTLREGNYAVRVVEGAIPRRLRGLVAFLHGLIGRAGF